MVEKASRHPISSCPKDDAPPTIYSIARWRSSTLPLIVATAILDDIDDEGDLSD
jgi:hypothetical protein